MIKILILFVFYLISIVYSSTQISTYANVVLKFDFSLNFEYYNIDDGSLVGKFRVPSENGEYPVSVVGVDNLGITYISYSKQDSQFCINYYSIQVNVTKSCISSISYQYNNIDYNYQPLISSQPSSLPPYSFSLVGHGNMGWLFYLVLDFGKGYYNETRATLQQSNNIYYVSGYDYYSETLYTGYTSGYDCLRFDVMNATTLQWFNKTSYCSSLLNNKYDSAIPIMYNSTRYLLTAYRDSKEIILKRIDMNNDVPTGIDLFKFVNIPNTPNNIYVPLYFATLRNEYLTIASYNNLGKIQVNTINLNTLSMTSNLIPPTYNVYSIFTF